MIGSCFDCRFWDGPDKNPRAQPGPRQQCRRRSPSVIAMPTPHGFKPTPVWPFTAKEEWCGDYVPDSPVKAVVNG